MSRPITRKLSSGTLLSAALAALAFGGWSQAQTICVKKSFPCLSKTAVVEVPDDGTVFCLNGVPIVKVISKAVCINGPAGPAVALRCGILSNGLSYSANGYTHNIGVVSGSNWETVMNGACADLTYSVN